MIGVLVLAFAALVLWGTVSKISKWRSQYKLAVTTKFPTFPCPVHLTDAWWMMSYPLFLPVLEKMPFAWRRTWLSMTKQWSIWKTGYLPFKEAEADTFILSTPKGNVLWTCDHAVIHDLMNQHPKVEIPVDLVGFYDIWGPTIGSTGGDQWKAHRKAVSAGFSHSMNYTVWNETRRQTQMLIEYWQTKKSSNVAVMRDWTSRLALHVITCGFFNMQLDWTEPEDLTAAMKQKKLSFDTAIILLIKRLAAVFMIPRGLLHKLPFAMCQETSLALTETERYITQQRAMAEANIDSIIKKRNPSILEAIVAHGHNPEITDRSPFMEEAVLSNMWFTLMAGHETVGSSLGFVFIFAALYPEVQRKMQAQLDKQLGSRPVDQWTLDQDYAALQKGYLGAVQKEILSVYHPASFLLRKVLEPVTVTDSDGVSHILPAGTHAMSNLSAAFKNPRVWHHAEVSEERRKATSNSPGLYFNPDRWMGNDGVLKETAAVKRETMNIPDYWAFGQGPRMCPGKAFAQIEMTAAMAVLFRDYSLELVVDEKTKAECGGDEKLAWEATRDRGIKMMYDDIEANITISLPTELPIRIVPRSRKAMS